MKTINVNISKLFAASMIIVNVFASCSKDSSAPVQAPSVNAKQNSASVKNAEVISINALAGTKAIEAVTGNTASLAAAAYYLPNGHRYPEHMDKAEVYMPEQGVHYQSAANYSSKNDYFFPEDGSLTIFSYAPYETLKDVVKIDPTVANGVTIPSEYDIEKNQDVYFMVASAVANKSANDSQNGLKANYSLAISEIGGLTISLGEDHETEVYNLKSVSISGHYTKGTYANGWTLSGEQSEGYVLYNESDENVITSEGLNAINTGNGKYLVLPQSFKEGQVMLNIVYTITTGETVQTISENVDMSNFITGFSANRKYDFNITLSQSGQITWNPSVSNWENC